jgi:hypothetical protein
MKDYRCVVMRLGERLRCRESQAALQGGWAMERVGNML